MSAPDAVRSALQMVRTSENLLRLASEQGTSDDIGAVCELLRLAVAMLGNERGQEAIKDTKPGGGDVAY